MEFRCEMIDTVRNLHLLMPPVATLKNAYRDRKPQKGQGGQESGDEGDEEQVVSEQNFGEYIFKKYPDPANLKQDLTAEQLIEAFLPTTLASFRMPLEVLACDYWVPGTTTRADLPKYHNSRFWREILVPGDLTCILYAKRATEDFARKAPKDATTKLKDLATVLKAGEEFQWDRINFVLEVRGETVDNFIAEAQDRTRNALASSLTAAFKAWNEQLRSDQVAFQSEKILCERENAKKRSLLVKQLEDCHNKAWRCVTDYMEANLKVFAGKVDMAENTLMPLVNGWITTSLSEISAVRAADDHAIIGWLVLPTAGVVGAQKWDWFLNFICNLLGQHRKNGMVIIVHSNRASQVKSSPNDKNSRKDLSQKERNLAVRNISWIFSPASVYGKRDGFMHGLAVVSREMPKNSIFRGTRGWKTGTIHDVEMLGRASMWKPEAAGGTSIIHKSLQAFLPASVATTVLVDIHGYDGFPAIACAEESRVLCGTICLDQFGEQQIEKRIAEKIYNDSRTGSLQISGFPQFDSLISAIKQGSNPRENRNYQVCTQKGDRLLVLQSYAAKFMDSDVTKDEATQAIEDHNKVFNQGGNFWEDDMTPEPSASEPPAKRIKIEPTDMVTETDVSSLKNPQKFAITNVSELITNGDGDVLFSFGSGEWRENAEAKDLMGDVHGRWYPFSATAETIVCLEKQGLPDHLKQLPSIETPMTLQALLMDLEVKVKLSHHSIADGPVITAEKPLVFVMDPPKEDAPDGKKKKRKHKKPDGPTFKNFGARLCVNKMKSCPRFIIGWRMSFPGLIKLCCKVA
ncbi:unnamed protein product [Cladocopium goreaui]|uniref:Uncharacterized protein n=1 Tax=Cladocopium goreaui TaxID=2562237 RepID=A0A9P1CF30_9DINO|nr:unnamed protein product [Cladocopium goreaui]